MSLALVPLGDLPTDVQPGFACGKEDSSGVLQVRMNNVRTDGSWDWSKKRMVPATEILEAHYPRGEHKRHEGHGQQIEGGDLKDDLPRGS